MNRVRTLTLVAGLSVFLSGPASAQAINAQTLQSLLGGFGGNSGMPTMPMFPSSGTATNPNTNALVGAAGQILPKLLGIGGNGNGNGLGLGMNGGGFGSPGAATPCFGPAGSCGNLNNNAGLQFPSASASAPIRFGPPAQNTTANASGAFGSSGADLTAPTPPRGGRVEQLAPNVWDVFDAKGGYVNRVVK